MNSSLRAGIRDDPQELLQREEVCRLLRFGSNKVPAKSPKPWWRYILDSLSDYILQILIAAAFVSLVTGMFEDAQQGWMEGAAILLAVVVVVSVTSVNEYSKDKQFRLLNAQAEDREVSVIRSGRDMNVSVFSLVAGDLLHIQMGEIMPVDGILILCNGITTDESSITGESDQISKAVIRPGDPNVNPFMLSGSRVVEGNGIVIVCGVGLNSFQGRAQVMMEEAEEENTPLQDKLEIIAEDIGKIGVAAGFLTFLALITYVIIDLFSEGWDSDTTNDFLESFIIMVTIIVVAVPEGLPLAVTLSLAYSVGKMKEENNFVRHLHACETMGGANNICTDKTGTMTENRMEVAQVYIGGNKVSAEDGDRVDSDLRQVLGLSICHNSTAFLTLDTAGQEVRSGNITECALLSLARKWGYDYQSIRVLEQQLLQLPFSNIHKRMLTVIRHEDSVLFFVKGAPETVVPLCTKADMGGGNVAEYCLCRFDSLGQEEVMNVVKTYAQAAQRCIAFAYKRRPDYEFASGFSESNSARETLESDLTFLAIVGIQDKVRANVPQAIITAQRAGVIVRMVTGDNVETAVKVAKECHLLPEDFQYQASSYYVMEGKEFRKAVGGLVTERDDKGKVTAQKPGDMENFTLVSEQLRVLARSSPEDKFLLVCGLKELGNVVAVTGDGSNDAPALRKSDVGISMNIAGTPLAKEAADILLMDDNFASIITAIKWGRNIYDCVRKFLQFQLTVNIVALVMCFVGAVITRNTPLTAVQMLWVNMIMDSFAALALATEYPSEELLNRPPYSRTESIITPDMWVTILSMAVYQMIWLFFILFAGDPMLDLDGQKKDTFFFHTFVLLQLFNEINCRKLKASELNVFKGITTQPLFYLIFFGTLIVQVLLVQFGGDPIGCSPLSLQEHFFCFAIGMSTLPAAFLAKIGPTIYRQKYGKTDTETLSVGSQSA